MTPLSDIEFILGFLLGRSNVPAPLCLTVRNIIRMMDREMAEAGIDFTSPELMREVATLQTAMEMAGIIEIEEEVEPLLEDRSGIQPEEEDVD